MASQYNTSITFGALTLYADRITPSKVPATVKQVVGKTLVKKRIPGNTNQDWLLEIYGKHPDTNRHTDRGTLEGYHDLKKHTLTDGIHDGDYFILDLRYEDGPNISTYYKFRLTIIQDQ